VAWSVVFTFRIPGFAIGFVVPRFSTRVTDPTAAPFNFPFTFSPPVGVFHTLVVPVIRRPICFTVVRGGRIIMKSSSNPQFHPLILCEFRVTLFHPVKTSLVLVLGCFGTSVVLIPLHTEYLPKPLVKAVGRC